MREKRIPFLLVALVFLAIALFVYLRFSQEENPFKLTTKFAHRENLCLFTLDTLRADEIGGYGNDKVYTPVMDRLIREGAMFREAYTVVPITAPSHYSIFQGVYTQTHGSWDNGHPINHQQPSLPSLFKSLGYNNAAFISGVPLVADLTDLRRYFPFYEDSFQYSSISGRQFVQPDFDGLHLQLKRDGEETTGKVLHWLQKKPDQPFFLWIHFYDPHTPYQLKGEYVRLYLERDNPLSPEEYQLLQDQMNENPTDDNPALAKIRLLYRAEVSSMDRSIGLILRQMNSQNLISNTLFVLVADHGESFEHGYYCQHSDRLYQSIIEVCLFFFKADGFYPEVIDQVAQTIDIFPTICELMGIYRDLRVEGRSLAKFIARKAKGNQPINQVKQDKEELDSAIFVETEGGSERQILGPQQCVIDGRYKLIRRLKDSYLELFDLENDPQELHNLKEKKPEIAERLLEKLKEWENRELLEMRLVKPRNEILHKKLKSLGYL